MGSPDSRMYETFLVDKIDHIATIRFNRPEKLNPINLQVMLDLEAIGRDLETDYDIRVVVITGEGRSFSVGADFASLREPLEQGGGEDLAVFASNKSPRYEPREPSMPLKRCPR